MEEPVVDSSPPETAEAAAEPAPADFVAALKKRWLLVVVGVLALLTLLVVGVVAFKASSAHKKNVEAQEEKRAVSGAVKDAETIVARKETLKAHQAILENSPSVPPPAQEINEPAVVEAPAPPAAKEKPEPAAVAKAEPQPVKLPAAAATAAKEESPPPAAAKPVKRAESKVAKLPATAGNCMLSGRSAEDYGQALSRCLEEFNRLDKRTP